MILEQTSMDPRIRRTRQMLFQAFEGLLTEKTFDTISVQDIAERSTVNRATFYDHFTDKFALLEAMIGEKFQARFIARMADSDGTCQEGLKRLVLAVCDFLAEVTSGCQKHQRQFEPMLESKVKSVVQEFLLAGMRKCDTSDAELKATMASWAICGAALQWSRDKKITAEKLAEAVLPMVRPALQK